MPTLRRPAREDSPSLAPRHGQERDRPHLLRLALLGQALRQDGRRGAPARPEEEARLQAQGGRGRQAAAGGIPGGTPDGNATRKARVPARCRQRAGERVDRKQDAQAPGMEPKKRTLGASERDEWLRAAWRALVAGEAGVDAARLVFVDEMGANTSLSPIHAWSRRGERARCSVPRNRGKNTTLLASMTLSGMGSCLAVVGGTTKEVFEAYVGRVLAPTLRPGQVVVADNLAAHKGEEVRELVEARGCELLFLPPYSPDYNPIEEAFSKIKGLLRKAQARTRETLIEALGAAISAVTVQDTRGFIEHCGYRLAVQLL